MPNLLGRANSSNVQKVLWMCDEVGVPFDHRPVGGAFGGNREDWFLRMNPNGLVPVLVDDGAAIWESNAIVRYLAARYGEDGLWPADPLQRALADRWMDWQITTLLPPMTTLFLGLVRTPPERRDAAALAAARDKAAQAWAIVADAVEPGPYVAGDGFGIADIALGIHAHRWMTLTSGLPKPSALEAWYARLCARPAYRTWVMVPIT